MGYTSRSQRAAATKAKIKSLAKKSKSSTKSSSKTSTSDKQKLLKKIEAGDTSAISEYNSKYGASASGSSGKKYTAMINGQKVSFDSKKEANDALDKLENKPIIKEEDVLSDKEYQKQLEQAKKLILDNPNLTPDLKSLFLQTLDGWDPNTEINIPNILSKFEEIKKNTIDPYFANEVIAPLTNQIKTSLAEQEQARALGLEAEAINAQEAIRGAQANLESSGMTFTGEGVRQLGQGSAYSGVPASQEGLVNVGNRLTASSSLAKYRQGLTELGQKAEGYLGSNILKDLDIPLYESTGKMKGSIYGDQQQAYGSTLTSLAGQASQNAAYTKPLDFNFPQYNL